MAKKKINEQDEFVSDDGYSTVQGPEVPTGGNIKKRKSDVKQDVHPDPEELEDDEVNHVEEEYDDEDHDEVDDQDEDDLEEAGHKKKYKKESFSSLFEGTDFSDDFKKKAEVVFEAAVHERAKEISEETIESIQEEFDAKIEESVDEALESVVENLDGYLDFIINEWLEENKLALESSFKVEMADSLMEGLKELFVEHNMEIDESNVDVVSELEESVEKANKRANKAINENIELREGLARERAERKFLEVCEDLTTSQIERMKMLSEKLDYSNLDSYEDDLKTIKESFFKKKDSVIAEEYNQEDDEVVIEEDVKPTKREASRHPTVAALVRHLDEKVKR